jgi:hypothetical protein
VITVEDIAGMSDEHPKVIHFLYTNYKGHRSVRRALLHGLSFRKTPYHPTPQWILSGFDLDKQADRDYALADCCFMKGEG